jgi:hypothetical protein
MEGDLLVAAHSAVRGDPQRRASHRRMQWTAASAGAALCVCAAALLGGLPARSGAALREQVTGSTVLLGDDLRLPYGSGDDLQLPTASDDDPLEDMMIQGGGDIRPPPAPAPATYRYSTPPTGVFTGHGHSVGGTPLTIGDNTYFVRIPAGAPLTPRIPRFLLRGRD